VLAICIVLMVPLAAAGFGLAALAGAACLCAGISFASLSRLLAFDSRGENPRLNNLLTAAMVGAGYVNEYALSVGLFILRMGIIRLPALAIGVELFVLWDHAAVV